MHHIFPSDFVFWKPVNEHNKIKKELLPLIYNNLNSTKDKQIDIWRCDVNTEFFESAENYTKYFKLIVNEIYPAIDALFNDINSLKIPKQSKVTRIWYNHYVESQGQEVHSHSGGSDNLSGIYLLHLEEPNKTVFYSHASQGSCLCDTTKQMNEIEEGNIILFPTHLLHYVLPCQKERITIAFNITIDF